MVNSQRWVAGYPILALLLLGGGGCYSTHERVLHGERYTCECLYDRTNVAVSRTATVLPDGGVSYGGTVSPGTPERGLRHVIHPCLDTVYDEEEACADACLLWNRYPRGYINDSGRYDGGVARYEGAGACDPGGTPERVFVWPSTPPEAIRNGVLVPSQSTVTVTVSGVGAEIVEPSSGYISTSGGGCEVIGGGGGMGCFPLRVHTFGFHLPTFELGTSTVTGARVEHSGTDEDMPSPFLGTCFFEGFGENHDR